MTNEEDGGADDGQLEWDFAFLQYTQNPKLQVPCATQHQYIYIIIYIISEETSIFAPQRLRFYRALGVAACTVGKVRASTVFMCVCSMFRPSDFLLFVKNGFVVGVRCQGNREPPADGATTPLSQRHAWLALPKQ